MRPRSYGARQEVAFDLTPLVDVVFILLLFVLLAANFAARPGFEVELPPAAHAASVQAGPILSLDEKGQVWLNRRLIGWEVLLRELERVEAGGVETMVIRADRRRPFEEVIALLDAVKGAGFEQVNLSTALVEGAHRRQ